MGPFTLLDFVGIETAYYTAEILQFGVRPGAAGRTPKGG
jgi:3-hydroxyacyl-CoA dehydrogenase